MENIIDHVPVPVYQYRFKTNMVHIIYHVPVPVYYTSTSIPVYCSSTPVQLRDQWSILCTRESGSSSSMKEAAKYSLNIEVYCIFLVKWNIFAQLCFTFVGEWKMLILFWQGFPLHATQYSKRRKSFMDQALSLTLLGFFNTFEE